MNAALLVSRIGDDMFALPCDRVREIVPAVAIQPLPGAPWIVDGVINIRGTIVPVLDVRQRFRLPSLAVHPSQHFIVCEVAGHPLALRVDRALDVITLDASAIQPAPGENRAQQLAGIAVLPDGLLVIHDLEAFLAADEAEALNAAVADITAPAVVTS